MIKKAGQDSPEITVIHTGQSPSLSQQLTPHLLQLWDQIYQLGVALRLGLETPSSWPASKAIYARCSFAYL